MLNDVELFLETEESDPINNTSGHGTQLPVVTT
jgi:hypothetical protein